eukprot:687454-Pyramimonas_sp.AAC.1
MEHQNPRLENKHMIGKTLKTLMKPSTNTAGNIRLALFVPSLLWSVLPTTVVAPDVVYRNPVKNVNLAIQVLEKYTPRLEYLAFIPIGLEVEV